MEYNVFQNNKLLDKVKNEYSWELNNILEIFQDDTKNATKIKKEDYLLEGEYPIIDQGQSYIAGYTNESDGLYESAPVIIFGDHTRIIKYVDFSFLLGADGVKVLKSKLKRDILNVKYVYYFLKTIDLPSDGYSRHFKYLKEVIIPIPSIEVQKKIISILDKAQELIDKRKKQLEELDELVKSRFIEMFGDPVLNPMNWEKKKLVDECNIVTGNTPSRKVEEYYGNYIEWIKSDNITNNDIYLTKAREYLSKNGLEVGRSVEENSILMTCIAGSVKCIGNVAIANRKVAFNQQINGIEPIKNNVFFMFVQFNLSQKYIQSTINMSLKGILSKGQLSELEFIFPPIELQNEFAKFFNQIDKLKFEMEKSLKELEDNFNSLMQKAFNGELFS